jgi:hypothetical protein
MQAYFDKYFFDKPLAFGLLSAPLKKSWLEARIELIETRSFSTVFYAEVCLEMNTNTDVGKRSRSSRTLSSIYGYEAAFLYFSPTAFQLITL